MIPYTKPQWRDITGSQSVIVMNLLQKGLMQEGCSVADGSSFSWQRDKSSLAHLGRRDHQQPRKVCVSKVGSWGLK